MSALFALTALTLAIASSSLVVGFSPKGFLGRRIVFPLSATSHVIDTLKPFDPTPLYEMQKNRLLELYQMHPKLVNGDHTKGEIEVVTDPERIAKIEEVMRRSLLAKGLSETDALEWSRVGIVSQDAFLLQLRNAVIFQNGKEGLFNLQLERVALDGTQCGAVALPLTETGEILFNLQYRHATGSWEMELARGFSRPKEPPVQTVIREMEEETGKTSGPPIRLGEVAPNTGVAAGLPVIYLCPVTGEGKSRVGIESIRKCIPFSLQQVANGLARGYLEHEGTQIPFRDGFSFAAILKAHALGYITLPQAEK